MSYATEIHATIACNLDADKLKATLPLFAAEQVEGIEWSFDALYKLQKTPTWFDELLQTFGDAGRLVGHGVFFSIFSAKWTDNHQRWLEHLKKMHQQFHFDHVTEHFGFMTGKNFHQGAPIGIPYTPETLAIGQDRLKRIYGACECPVGLENLAFAYSLDEVKRHGDFLEKLIECVNGFIILDLHNLYCQIHNFDISYEDIIEFYPLEKVREIHISGGSWEDSELLPQKKIRRDTHDDAVPKEVFDLLKKTLPLCPNVKYVVMEQLGHSIKSEETIQQFQQDFLQMKKLIENHKKTTTNSHHIINSFLPKNISVDIQPLENQQLYHEQIALSNILETANDLEHANQLLAKSSLLNSEWQTEKWVPHMLETVIQIAQKWKDGF